MKKIFILIISIIVLVLTFVFAEIFSIYNFGSAPTLLTSLYLMSIFTIFEYLAICITYIIRKLVKKEKLEVKKVIGLILLFVALLLILLFLMVVDIDYLNWYAYISPFYINVLVRGSQFILPATLLIFVSYFLIRKK